jgi:hypothetical protein
MTALVVAVPVALAVAGRQVVVGRGGGRAMPGTAAAAPDIVVFVCRALEIKAGVDARRCRLQIHARPVKVIKPML